MAPIGHVTMHGKEYRLRNPLVQVLANQMAPKIGQGESEYSNLDSWSAWVQDDWSAGLGRLQPHKYPGYAYGEGYTLIPSQIILPPEVGWCPGRAPAGDKTDAAHMSVSVTTTQVVTPSQKLAMKFRTPDAIAVNYWALAVLLRASAPGIQVNLEIWNSSGGAPSTVRWNTVSGLSESGGFEWMCGRFNTMLDGLATNTDYFAVVYPVSGSITVACSTNAWAEPYFHNGTSWATTTAAMVYVHGLHGANTPRIPVGADVSTIRPQLATLGDSVYLVHQNATGGIDALYKLDESTSPPHFDYVTGLGGYQKAGDVHHAEDGAGVLYIATADPNSPDEYITFDGTTASAVSLSGLHYAFFRGGGYMWRISGTSTARNRLFYTSDPSDTTSWTEVEKNDADVLWVTGMGRDAYYLTPTHLCMVIADFGIEVAELPSPIVSDEAYSVCAHEGRIYIAANFSVYEIGPDGLIQDIWLTKDEDVVRANGPLYVHQVVSTPFGLVAAATPKAGLADNTVTTRLYIRGTEGWHFLAQLPWHAWTTSGIVYVPRSSPYLLVPTHSGVFQVPMPSGMVNPYNASTSKFHCSAWMEWDWWYGPIVEAEKDIDSVTVVTENSSANARYVQVYWMNELDTTWRLLGTTGGSDIHEIVFDDTDTRPSGRRIRLGIHLFSNDRTETIRIRAIRVKYHLMVKDWFRWTLPIIVAGGLNGAKYLEMLNGEYETRDAGGIKADLDDLATRTHPFKLTDNVAGGSYDVKVIEANFSYDKIEWNQQAAAFDWSGVYTFTVEAVRAGSTQITYNDLE